VREIEMLPNSVPKHLALCPIGQMDWAGPALEASTWAFAASITCDEDEFADTLTTSQCVVGHQ